jgi:hypothetical protein
MSTFFDLGLLSCGQLPSHCLKSHVDLYLVQDILVIYLSWVFAPVQRTVMATVRKGGKMGKREKWI